jgi:small basic protein
VHPRPDRLTVLVAQRFERGDVAVLLTFIGDRLGVDLYLVALITFGPRIFNNVALIRRHFL